MNLNTFFRENKLRIYAVLAPMIFIAGYYLSVYEAYRYQSNNAVNGVVMMFVTILFYPIILLSTKPEVKLKIKVNVIILVLFLMIIVGSIIIPLVLITDYARETYVRSVLRKNGIQSTAIVVGFEHEHVKSSRRDFATIHYKVGDKIIRQRISNSKDIYRIDQSIPILISSEYPEMFDLLTDDN